MAEGLRLLYVALTRAKHRCTVIWGGFGSGGGHGFHTSALGYLLHGPDSPLEPTVASVKEHVVTCDDVKMLADLPRVGGTVGGGCGGGGVGKKGSGCSRVEPEYPTAEGPARGTSHSDMAKGGQFLRSSHPVMCMRIPLEAKIETFPLCRRRRAPICPASPSRCFRFHEAPKPAIFFTTFLSSVILSRRPGVPEDN